MTANKHGNVALFVPHVGCPCRCSFCDQRAISGNHKETMPQDVKDACSKAIKIKGDRTLELAFFGGSFTAIKKEYMISLLDAAFEFLGQGINGIRISTRPDAINKEILSILKEKGVTAIELGAQSMQDNVLKMNNRGHLSSQTVSAVRLIREFGFESGLQMMTGLYGSTKQDDWITACKIAELCPDTVRIYPTLTLVGTQLCSLFEKGVYIPQTLSEAVAATAEIIKLMNSKSINVIRVGLHPSKELEEKIIAGPYHPAFKELCDGEILSQLIVESISDYTKSYIAFVHPKDISKLRGHKKQALLKLLMVGIKVEVKPSFDVKQMTVHVIMKETEGRE